MPSSAKKRTVATKRQEPPPAAPSHNFSTLPTPAPTLASAPAPLPISSVPTPPTSASSSSSYKPITDDASIERLIGLAKDSPPDSALGIVWRHAFEEGKRIGYSEGAQMVDGIDINEVLRTGVEKGIEKGIERGIEIGRDREKRAWGAAGHSNVCITVARPPRGVAVQTENDPPPHPTATAAVQVDAPNDSHPRLTSMAAVQVDAPKHTPPRSVTTTAVQVDTPNPPLPPHVKIQADIPRNTTNSAVQTSPLGTRDAGSQALPPPSPIPDPIRITAPPSPPLNWADDVVSLPLRPISSPPILSNHPPRDLSALRSSSLKPFASLQRRNKRSQAHFPQSFHNQQPFYRSYQNSFRRRFPPARFSSIPIQSAPVYPHHTPHFSSTSALNWDKDPRLFELSRALNALGWIRPQQGRCF